MQTYAKWYWCAICRPTWCGQPELCSYLLTQNRHSLWLVTHKTALQWYERLAGSSFTKLIGQQQLSEWFLHLPERRCFISTKNQRFLRKIQKPAAELIKAYICQFSSTLLKSISWDSPFKQSSGQHTLARQKIYIKISAVAWLHLLVSTLFSCKFSN